MNEWTVCGMWYVIKSNFTSLQNACDYNEEVTSNKFLSKLEGSFRASDLLLQGIWSANHTHTIILFADFIKFSQLGHKTQDTLVK